MVSDLSEKVSVCPKEQNWVLGDIPESLHCETSSKGDRRHATRRAQKEDSLYRCLGDPLGRIISLCGSTYAMVKRTAGTGKSKAP